MRIPIIITLLLLTLTEAVLAKISPTRLTCEYLKDPQVIDITNPRLSWVNIDQENRRNQFQTAWQIRVAGSKDYLFEDKSDLWNSGKVVSNESTNIIYSGKPLTSRQDCWWQVRVWDNNGKVSEWSEPAFWSMGLLKPEEWKAKWIGAPWQGEDPIPDKERPLTASRAKPGQAITDINALTAPPPAPMLRKGFRVDKEISSARAFVTGLGYFELWLNGKKVGEDVLVPNQTNYGKRPGLENNPIPLEDNFLEYRVLYLSYDIKDLLKKGDNVIGAILGNGFYNAPINWTESYGTPRFLGQIYLTYTDGTEDVIVSDQSWKTSKSPIIMDLIFDGEHYDARLEQPGWCTPGFDDSKWKNAALRKAPEGILKAHMSYPDRVMERIEPVKIDRLGEGHYKVDFGQEISGWVNLSGINVDPEQPGYRHIIFRPQPVSEISYASYSNLTTYGTCSINWKKENGKFMMELEVPVGSKATVFVPARERKSVLENGKKIKRNAGITFSGMENGYAVFNVGSGNYRFESEL